MVILRLRRDRLRVVHGVAGQRQQVDAVPLQRPLRVEPGQQQQVLDEQTHPAGLALDAAHQHLDVAGGALPVQLGEAADRGQRRAQLVAGVGDEPAHPVLGGAGLLGRRLRRRHRALDLREHSVERQRQSADFGARITLRDTTVELSGGDRRGGLLDLDQWPQAAMDHRDSRRRRAPAAPPHRCRPATRSAPAPSTERRTGRSRRWSARRAARAPSSPATARASGRSSRR